jgi:hypothetical protein
MAHTVGHARTPTTHSAAERCAAFYLSQRGVRTHSSRRLMACSVERPAISKSPLRWLALFQAKFAALERAIE